MGFGKLRNDNDPGSPKPVPVCWYVPAYVKNSWQVLELESYLFINNHNYTKILIEDSLRFKSKFQNAFQKS